MANLAVNWQTSLYVTECPVCFVLHGFPREMYERLRSGRLKNIYCPSGHSWIITETEIDKLKKELEATNRRLINAQSTAQMESQRADRERKTRQKLEKRVHNGVCVHCNRTFLNMTRHMRTKHKDLI